MVTAKAKYLDVTQVRRALSLKQTTSGENPAPSSILFTHGSLVVEVYQPVKTDHQKPHDHGECYFIIEGHRKFEMGDEIVSCSPDDFLFVPAGLPYRFTDFDDTMSTWVMFYGPDNGENSNSAKNQLDIVNFIVIACVNQAALKIGQHDAIKHRLPQATRGLTHAARHERQYAQDS